MLKKKLALVLAMAMAASLALSGCGNPHASSSGSGSGSGSGGTSAAAPSGGSGETAVLATGGSTGTYYGVGSGMCTVLNPIIGDVLNMTATSTGASKENVQGITDDKYQLAILQSDVLTYAHNGQDMFEEPETDALWVAGLYNETVQITARGGITDVSELAGKTVCVGDRGSGTEFNARQVLEAYGMTTADITATNGSFGDAANDLKDGKIDAAFVVAGAPTVAITTLATAKDTYLVGLDDEHIAKLQESSPYYEEYIIPEGTYEGVPETKTVAVVATVIARDDVSEEDVYNICYTIFENMDNLAHDKAGELDVEFASGVTAVPYHAGAAKYFAEKGFDVPTK